MSDIFDLTSSELPLAGRYSTLGLPYNPFSIQSNEGDLGPFYREHLQNALSRLQDWLKSALLNDVQPVSIKGSIGVGKTRLLLQIKRQINDLDQSYLVSASYARIDKTGYRLPSIGQMVLEAIEQFPRDNETPEGIIPVIWKAANSPITISRSSLMGRVAKRLQSADINEKMELARLLCRWLHRNTLTVTQSERIGLHGRLDYEGQLPEILADLLLVLKECTVINKIYLMIDQLEDVFRPGYSELRRSRILTDLRTLIDVVTEGAPIALVLAWSPEVDDPRFITARSTDAHLNTEYPALYSRLTRNMVELPKLDLYHATPFVQVYLEAASKAENYEAEKVHKASFWVSKAWELLSDRKRIPDNRVTPRDLLSTLSEIVESMINDSGKHGKS